LSLRSAPNGQPKESGNADLFDNLALGLDERDLNALP
jgi:hypothetical protein